MLPTRLRNLLLYYSKMTQNCADHGDYQTWLSDIYLFFFSVLFVLCVVSLYIRTTPLSSCKYRENLIFKLNLKEIYSPVSIFFFVSVISSSVDIGKKTKPFNLFLPPKNVYLVFPYVLDTDFRIGINNILM